MATKTLLDARECAATLNRLCCQLNEVHFPWNNSVIIGLQPRGTQLAKALIQLLKTQHGVDDVPFGALDITFHRDDFRRREEPLAASPNEMNVLIEGKRVILVDDVLYTGRSVRAAMDALGDYGRPTRVELCVLVDRRFSRELPIQPDFSGRRVDAIAEERV
ncbi:MAG: bifunctional pyr operon transcriptional regulator/uracil phosphoribosyltransferase PyrR, partial [Schleiferiaceae bacterium]